MAEEMVSLYHLASDGLWASRIHKSMYFVSIGFYFDALFSLFTFTPVCCIFTMYEVFTSM